MKDTLVKVAEYTNEDKEMQYYKMRKIIGDILIRFGVFLIISAMTIENNIKKYVENMVCKW